MCHGTRAVLLQPSLRTSNAATPVQLKPYVAKMFGDKAK